MRRMLCICLVLMMLPYACAESGCDVNAAIDVLKACWKEEVYSFAPEGGKGYLEIKNTRIVEIQDEPKAEDEYSQALAEEYFSDVEYIVEFMLYSDLMGMEPYYQEAEQWKCVLVYKDGSMEAVMQHPFDAYRSKTYSVDISGIIEAAVDLHGTHNAVFYLLEE